MFHPLTRRVLLRTGAVGVGAFAGGAMLAACGASGSAVSTVAATSAAAPITTLASTTSAVGTGAAAVGTSTTTAASAVTTSRAVTSTTTSVSAAPKSAAAAGKIRFSYIGGQPNDTVFSKLAGQFNTQNPGAQVSVEGTWNWDNNKYLVQASGGDAADIVWSSETFASQLFIAGATADLDSLIAKDAQFKASDYFETVLAAYKYQGKQVGLPILWGAYVMWYNKTLFDIAGQAVPNATWTWDTFLAAAKALTKPSSDPAVFGQYGFETRNHQNVWSPWVWGAGGDLFSADGLTCTLSSPESIAGIQYVLDLMHKWKVAPTAKDLAAQKLTEAFGPTGKVAMIWNAIYLLPTYRKYTSFEWDIAPIPRGPHAYFTTNPTSGLAMWKGTHAPDTAWEFMRYLVSEEAEKLYVTSGVSGMPVQKAAAQLILTQPGPPAHKQVFYDAFSYAKPAFTTPYGQNAINILQSQGKFGDMWSQGLPAQDVLTAAMPIVNAAIQAQITAKK